MSRPDRISGWTGEDVRAFMLEHRMKSATELSEAIGISRNRAYQISREGAMRVPRTLALAMLGWSAVAMGLDTWKRPGKRKSPASSEVAVPDKEGLKGRGP